VANPPNLSQLEDAKKSIEYMMKRGGFVEYTKRQFAAAMGWYKGTGKDDPDRARVERMCNLTRDQDQWGWVSELLGGFAISYAPQQGGMILVDESGEIPLDHMWHQILGDLQLQHKAQTMNKRRLPTWRKAGSQSANNDNLELARLCWQAENEIEHTGFVTETTYVNLIKSLRALGFME